MIKGNSIQLSAHFTYKKMFRFVLAPICTMLFTSIYGIVDGFFVSNYVGNTAFASLNLVMPYIMMIASVGFMFGSGGNALVSLHLGLGEKKKANEYFSLIVYTLIGIGVVLAAVSFFLASEHEKAAIKFLKYAASREGNIAYAECMKRLPARLDVIREEKLDIPGFQVFQDYVNHVELKERPFSSNPMKDISRPAYYFNNM